MRTTCLTLCLPCLDHDEPSSLNVLWQVLQYALIGVLEVFMYVGHLAIESFQMLKC